MLAPVFLFLSSASIDGCADHHGQFSSSKRVAQVAPRWRGISTGVAACPCCDVVSPSWQGALVLLSSAAWEVHHACAMATTRLFRNGHAQAVRIPADLAYERIDLELDRRADHSAQPGDDRPRYRLDPGLVVENWLA